MSAGFSARQRRLPIVRGLCVIGVVLLASSARGDDGTVGRSSGVRGWSVDYLPSPTLDPSGCGHPAEKLHNGSFLCDPDGLLTSLGAQRVETRLEDILTLQSPCGGEDDSKQHVEGGVAVVSRMLPSSSSNSFGKRKMDGGGGGGNEAVSAEQFARGVQDSWRVGKKGCDNGFLLVASREDRSFAISVGKGLEPYLTPKDRNAALNSMKPLLREGDWDAAVLLALGEIHGRLGTNLSEGKRGGLDAGPMSSFGQGWDDIKQRVAAEWGGGGGGDGGGGGGGGGGGIFPYFFGPHWPQDVSPESALLALALLWGGAAARRASLQRRQYNGFEAKLAGIEAQRATLPPSAGGGWSIGKDALASPGACPICLDTFSAAAAVDDCHAGVGERSGGPIGSDGLPTATSGCGHTFCQSCLSRWHGESDPPPTHDGTAPSYPCPICDSPTPALGDPRLGRPHRRRRRRLAPERRRQQRPARQRRPRRGTFGFTWPGFSSRGARATMSQGVGVGESDMRFSSPGPPSGWGSAATAAAQGMLAKPIAPPPLPPPPPPSTPPPPPPSPPPQRTIMPPVPGKASDMATRRGLGATGGQQARERARREAAFQLASLGSQYPKFLDDRTVNRWLSKDYSSSWSRDQMLHTSRPPEIGGGAGDHGTGGAKKGSGWVSTRSSSGFGGTGGGGGRRPYGGGSSSSATGGGW